MAETTLPLLNIPNSYLYPKREKPEPKPIPFRKKTKKGVISDITEGAIRVATDRITQIRKIDEENDGHMAKLVAHRKIYTDAVAASQKSWQTLVDAFDVDKFTGNLNTAQLALVLKVWQKGVDPCEDQVNCMHRIAGKLINYLKQDPERFGSSKHMDKIAAAAGTWLAIKDNITWIEDNMRKYDLIAKDQHIERWHLRLTLNELNGGYEADHNDVDQVCRTFPLSRPGKIDGEELRDRILDWMTLTTLKNEARFVENARFDAIEMRARERAGMNEKSSSCNIM